MPDRQQNASLISDQAARLSVQLDRIDRQRLRGPAATRLGTEAQISARAISRRRRALVEAGIGALGDEDPAFPELLLGIPDPPLLLYYRGDLDCLDGMAVAIVGARRASAAGLAFARTLAGDLAAAGAVIVSGLALGVDAEAHAGALDAGGRTVAVLGSSAERITPLANAALGERILAAGGLILSEYPLGTPAAPFRFPERNRLISGLCRGVVVIEATERSGSLITARLAAEQGREVMAVPGAPGYPNSAGSNRLLKSGAALIERAADVLHAISADGGPGRPIAEQPDAAGLTLQQQQLLDLLDGRAQGLDVLAGLLGLEAGACAVALTELELNGFVQRVGGGYIRRPSEF